ncbi:MAG: hypothetical protein HY881_09760 [Deltaproteobacteria bacterium]|nr:hypothetical protein [Deltaproteobacteria bacterium]
MHFLWPKKGLYQRPQHGLITALPHCNKPVRPAVMARTMKMKTTVIVAVILLIAGSAIASREGVLPFSEFKIQSEGIGESGAVTVEGKKDSAGNYQMILVKAFGKTIEISEELLGKIPSKYQNGIQLSYERGYEVLGGRTIYIMFLSGFTSGNRESFVIEVTEKGQQSILKTP